MGREDIQRRNEWLRKNCSKIQVSELIASGGCGDVYKGTITDENGRTKIVAIKLEKGSGLKQEHDGYVKVLQSSGKRFYPGFPKCYLFKQTPKISVMAMTLLGPSLAELCGKRGKLSIYTVCLVALQVIGSISYVHSVDLVHRDLKPHNLLTGIGSDAEACCLYLADFGLCCKYRDRNGKHLPEKKSDNRVGTYMFMGRDAMLGSSPSRQDDLQSILYTLVYLLKGYLPWSRNLPRRNLSAKFAAIRKMKRDITAQELCKGLPTCFVEFGKYVLELRHAEDPDYSYMQDLFKKYLSSKSETEEIDFMRVDWLRKEDKMSLSKERDKTQRGMEEKRERKHKPKEREPQREEKKARKEAPKTKTTKEKNHERRPERPDSRIVQRELRGGKERKQPAAPRTKGEQEEEEEATGEEGSSGSGVSQDDEKNRAARSPTPSQESTAAASDDESITHRQQRRRGRSASRRIEHRRWSESDPRTLSRGGRGRAPQRPRN